VARRVMYWYRLFNLCSVGPYASSLYILRADIIMTV